MRHLSRSFGACALAVFALGIAGTATASAAEYPLTGLPEIGRCVLDAGHGEYKGRTTKGNCVTHSPTKTGNWDWLPGPGANATVEERMIEPVLETTGGNRIKCTDFLLKGEITSGKTEKINQLIGQGCLMVGPNLPCYSKFIAPGTIESNIALKGELGFIPGSKTATSWVGWDLKPESELSKTVLEFECGEAKPVPTFKVVIEGSVIGRTVKFNKMETKYLNYYKQKEGIQIPTMMTGGLPDTLTQITTPTLNPTEPKTEQVGLASTVEVTYGEKLEIRTKEKPPEQ
jgi:hypothetical protein